MKDVGSEMDIVYLHSQINTRINSQEGNHGKDLG